MHVGEHMYLYPMATCLESVTAFSAIRALADLTVLTYDRIMDPVNIRCLFTHTNIRYI